MADSLVPNYFFMDGKIYKKLSIVRSEDFINVWSYADERRMRFNYSSVRRNATKAYSLREVSEIMERSAQDISMYVSRGFVPKPSGFIYHIASKRPHMLLWSQDDILYLRDRIYEVAPKKQDGTPFARFKLLSKAELLAKLKGDASYYVKDSEGNMVRVWKSI